MKNSGAGAGIGRSALCALMLATMMTGCGGGGGGSAPAATTSIPTGTTNPSPMPAPDPTPSPSPSPGNNSAPSINASPLLQIEAGAQYSLLPDAEDPDGDTLAFSITNRPEWAQFSTVTGELSGTPGPQHAGTHVDIVISVSDGHMTASLPAFSVTVAPVAEQGVVLQWEVPTEAADGSPLGELAGFRIHFGQAADMLSQTIELQTPGIASYVIDHLPPGTYYFAVRAVDADGGQSELSNVIEKVVG